MPMIVYFFLFRSHLTCGNTSSFFKHNQKQKHYSIFNLCYIFSINFIKYQLESTYLQLLSSKQLIHPNKLGDLTFVARTSPNVFAFSFRSSKSPSYPKLANPQYLFLVIEKQTSLSSYSIAVFNKMKIVVGQFYYLIVTMIPFPVGNLCIILKIEFYHKLVKSNIWLFKLHAQKNE